MSPSDAKRRPAWEQLLDDIEAGSVDAVVGLLQLAQVPEPRRSATAHRPDQGARIAHRDGRERGHRPRLSRRAHHGSLGLGYSADGSIVPDEAEAIRDAAERVLNGESLGSVVRVWQAHGFTARTPAISKESLSDRRRVGGVLALTSVPLNVRSERSSDHRTVRLFNIDVARRSGPGSLRGSCTGRTGCSG